MNLIEFLRRGEQEGAFVVTSSAEIVQNYNSSYFGTLTNQWEIMEFLQNMEDFGYILELDPEANFFDSVEYLES